MQGLLLCFKDIFEIILELQTCFQRAAKHSSKDIVQCPHCRDDVAEKDKLGKEFENPKLQEALNLLFPGYGAL